MIPTDSRIHFMWPMCIHKNAVCFTQKCLNMHTRQYEHIYCNNQNQLGEYIPGCLFRFISTHPYHHCIRLVETGPICFIVLQERSFFGLQCQGHATAKHVAFSFPELLRGGGHQGPHAGAKS